ncbi:unknown [Clostridium sp. CAG:122]|nr:unknown [Clostridium sp. CAG:122]
MQTKNDNYYVKNISLNEMFAYNDKSRNIVGKEDIVKEENEKILKEENIKRIVKMISKGYSKEEVLELDYTEEEYEEAEKGLFATV